MAARSSSRIATSTRIVMSAADWDVIDRLGGTKPAARHGRDRRREAHARRHDGDALHHARSHARHALRAHSRARQAAEAGTLAALWGGTGLNADRDSLEAYIRSAQRFDDIAQKAGADIILSNHTDWDGSKVNLPRLATRAPGSSESVRRRHAGGPEVSRGRRRMCHRPPSAAELDPEPRLCWRGAHATRSRPRSIHSGCPTSAWCNN